MRAEYPQLADDDDVDRHAFELWRWYHEETEAFDRSVCTGPIRNGSIFPANGEQMRKIGVFAMELASDVELWVARLGVSVARSRLLRWKAAQ